MKPKDPLPWQETAGVFYRIWCRCGPSNYVGETGRLLRTRMADNVAAVRKKEANSQVAAHSTGHGRIFKFNEAELFARDEVVPFIDTVVFVEEIIQAELLNLKESTSAGPDAIPTNLLKKLVSKMVKPLGLLFQASFDTGSGGRASVNNYRQMSLTSICCKTMEKITKKALMQSLEQNHLLSDAQHGFRSGWTKARSDGKMVHDSYIDFKKAVDSVSQRRSHNQDNLLYTSK
ncbi:unnamed protein product [Dibothriocephalus latus]|uniref:Reverse transcriptase domain-containing protein n=1 Tax=Dibothriocephalus latus TaxID=60516 RepID=A0A3P7M9Z2_DIBLA|nr:unnamed protein product [Dibothriocephalus latus]